MMKSEDAQLSKENSDIEINNTVLVASRSTTQSTNNLAPVMSQSQPQMFHQGFQTAGYGSGNQSVTQQQVGSHAGYGSENQSVTQQEVGSQQQYFPNSNSSRNFNRGKGGRKFHCDICGRNNHSTNYCYYRQNGTGYQWRGLSNMPQVFSPMYAPQGMQGIPGMPMIQNLSPQFNNSSQGQNGFKASGSSVQTVPTFVPSAPSMLTQSTPVPTAFAGFTGQSSMSYVPCFVPSVYTPGNVSGGEMITIDPYSETSANSGSGSQPCVPLTTFDDIEISLPIISPQCQSPVVTPTNSCQYSSYQHSSIPVPVSVPPYSTASFPVSIPVDNNAPPLPPLLGPAPLLLRNPTGNVHRQPPAERDYSRRWWWRRCCRGLSHWWRHEFCGYGRTGRRGRRHVARVVPTVDYLEGEGVVIKALDMHLGWAVVVTLIKHHQKFFQPIRNSCEILF
ncbi:hypothetical protein Vadar_016537 [Vaccinium darrowii]|uniref:Uncharacterized protein n=1 Tax=Vaccinium darrowii TaxID=229202 RepID=A0ACB7YNE8_9ERIC|nr:hypothetical protein Vadar_016537 [Vaccinium darrowii]